MTDTRELFQRLGENPVRPRVMYLGRSAALALGMSHGAFDALGSVEGYPDVKVWRHRRKSKGWRRHVRRAKARR